MTPEQAQLGIKLESIFMPHARKQRDAAYKIQTGSTDAPVPGTKMRFVHYTSAEAALSIINEKRIWMRNTNCMSDYREVHHGFDFLHTFFADKAKLDGFCAALDACVPGAALEAVRLFDGWLQDTRENTYIMSISEHDIKEDFHGRLSMWRAFGGNTARVAIVFAVPWLAGGAEHLNLMFSPVAYLTESELHTVIYEVIENINKNGEFIRSVDRQIIVGMVFAMLLAAVTCLKHEGFREEREWRAIYSPQRRPSPLMEAATKVISGVPQIVYKLPIDVTASPLLEDLDFAKLFDRLIIGPSSFPSPMSQAFTAALIKAGVTDAASRVFFSNIPIRS